MVSRYRNSAYGFPKPAPTRQTVTGHRFPRHDGARSCEANEGIVLAAVPILQGETLTRQEIDWHIGRTDNDNPDQTFVVEWGAVFIPINWGTTQEILSTAVIDNIFEKAFNVNPGQHQFGGEPNPAGESNYLGTADIGLTEVLWHESFLAHSQGHVGRLEDEIAGTDDLGSRLVNYGRRTISRNFRFNSSGMVLYGCLRGQQSSQTDFGVADIDNNLTPVELAQALDSPIDSNGTDQDKLRELLFGGDSYIEANTRATGTAHASMTVETVIRTRFSVDPE